MKLNKSIVQMQIRRYFYATIISTIHTIQIKLGRQHSNNKIRILFILFILFTLNSEALAIDNSQSILNTLQIGLKGWIPIIKSACLYVFWTLVTIDLVWTFGMQALRGFEIGEYLATLIKKVIFIGVMLFLFNVDYWLKLIFDSFSQLATNVSGSIRIGPDNIISSAFKIVSSLLKTLDFDIALSLLKIFAGLIILIAFVLMAIDLLIVYLKFYIMNIIIFFALALGGLEKFKEIGLNPVITAIKVGIELFMIQALMGLCIITINNNFNTLTKYEVDLILQIFVMALIFCMITKMIPGLIEAVFNGTVGDSAGASAGFRAVATMAAGAVATGVGGSIGVTRAMNAAKEAHLAEGGKGGMNLVRGVAKHLATTSGEHLKDNFRHGRMPNDIANRLQEKVKSSTNSNLSGGISGNSKIPNEPYISGVNSDTK
ncbi:P-type conjugative transfer protein TrbL [Campylobacter sp. RM12327]|uniref:P-type conjugative transfer protein TrbL n=2 Tax=Campylobacter sputorum TaxID=206 RepID=UPI000B79906C|nr:MULTISPECIES: P-type conjugative transfer protein TrbL [unclassified Campylobacter]ASM39447.1 P-type conjugative transfer protein TrbL [Campylobacter sputorum]MBF6674218.1 P-type conjugative transfer protein TrbL [Campylobacter sp. RM13538]MBF6676643.1 P-type conjugative transfer protein TrbL [Campylobacter sp. RM12321]MBF6670014.1 P-type conjugative transfer protein TrbL [Campylobacter sp. RM12327]MBF6678413.1 P-type conjugative transfer protein TrbL [Campylobacter sp. RM11259]